MLAAFQMYGITPGPLLFSEQPDLVWTLIASLYLANVSAPRAEPALVGIWVKILMIPRPMLAGCRRALRAARDVQPQRQSRAMW